MRRKRNRRCLLAGALLGLILLNGCSAALREAKPQPLPAAASAEKPLLTLLAAGDNLPHLSLIRAGLTEQGYDFRPLYAPLAQLTGSADVAFVNMEAPINAACAYAGFPRFNAPPELGQALAAAGFTVVNQANNHILDQGVAGLRATAQFWQGLEGVTLLGISATEQRQAAQLTEVNGYRLAWLGYTYGVNIPPDETGGYQLNLMERESMAQDIAAAREQADAVIVSLHWGEEYQAEPSPEQRELARFLVAAGARLIIGHHPHVLQPLEWLGGPDGQRALVAYSLGNFISAQDKRETMLGGLLAVEFAAGEQGLVIERAGVWPLVTHYQRGYTHFAVYPLADYGEELARRHALFLAAQPLTPQYLRQLAQEVLGEFYWPLQTKTL